VPSVVNRREIAAEETTQDDAKPLEVSALCVAEDGGFSTLAVEALLAAALLEAAKAGRFDVVAQLAGELEARCLERGGKRCAVRCSPSAAAEARLSLWRLSCSRLVTY
jgi:hypothetical protein